MKRNESFEIHGQNAPMRGIGALGEEMWKRGVDQALYIFV